MIKNLFEKIKKKWTGRILLESFEIKSQEAILINNFLENAINIAPEIFEEKINRLREICNVRQKVVYNQIVLSGRSVFAQRLNAETTYTGAINYGLVGTGSTAVSDSDIKLVTETKRKGIATRTRTGDSVSFRFFYSKSDVSGTLTEFGTVIDGTATVDTGQLFNRVLTGGWVKSASEALTVTVQFDLNPS